MEGSPPKVNIASPEVVIREGDSFELKCMISSLIAVNASWSFNGSELITRTAE